MWHILLNAVLFWVALINYGLITIKFCLWEHRRKCYAAHIWINNNVSAYSWRHSVCVTILQARICIRQQAVFWYSTWGRQTVQGPSASPRIWMVYLHTFILTGVFMFAHFPLLLVTFSMCSVLYVVSLLIADNTTDKCTWTMLMKIWYVKEVVGAEDNYFLIRYYQCTIKCDHQQKS